MVMVVAVEAVVVVKEMELGEMIVVLLATGMGMEGVKGVEVVVHATIALMVGLVMQSAMVAAVVEVMVAAQLLSWELLQ